jgi:hypothetical protein
MNVFGNWKQADVDAFNARTAASKPTPIVLPVLEKDLHEQIADYCRKRGYYFVHSRMDRRSTVQVGCPDFIVFLPSGRVVCLEAKRKGGKPTPAQQATIAHLHKLGHAAGVVESFLDALQMMP